MHVPIIGLVLVEVTYPPQYTTARHTIIHLTIIIGYIVYAELLTQCFNHIFIKNY